MRAWTDYPILALDDQPHQLTPVHKLPLSDG